MTAERRPEAARSEPCRCALCQALMAAVTAAEQNVRERRKMLTIVTSDRRSPAA